jgi:predicted DCC family thiol-disulfide oxidoreductase YuxK
MKIEPVTVFYDGKCPLCSREIAHYRRRTKDAAVSFVDIASPTFDAAIEGIDLERAHAVLHVKVGQEMRTGIDAVVSMWERHPHIAMARAACATAGR